MTATVTEEVLLGRGAYGSRRTARAKKRLDDLTEAPWRRRSHTNSGGRGPASPDPDRSGRSRSACRPLLTKNLRAGVREKQRLSVTV